MRILSIDGGGYLGLATASFLRGVERHFNLAFHERFDLFCGTSTGAIIALALACGRSGEDIVKLYKEFGPAVFCRRGLPGRLYRLGGFLHARYSNEALQSALKKEFGETTLADVLSRRKRLLVTAFDVSTGQPRVFKTDHSENLTLDGDLKLADVALASSAAPIYLPLVRVANPRAATTAYCDGGVVANHPALLGFVEAISELRSAPSDVELLSISTPRVPLGEGAVPEDRIDRGIWGWWKTLPAIVVDSNSTMVHHVLTRLVASYPSPGPQYVRVSMSNDHRLPMDRADQQATDTLEMLGANTAANNEIRQSLRRVLGIQEVSDGRRPETV